MHDPSVFDLSPEAREELKKRLHSKLISLGRNYVLGSQLGPLINESLELGTSYRNFFRAGTVPKLRTFVEQFLNELVVPTNEKKGADLIYEIRGSMALEMPSGGGQLWRSFVAVEPTQTLIFDSNIAAIKMVPLGATVPHGCFVITPVSLDEHRKLCNEFVKKLTAQGNDISALREVAATYTERSYTKWLNILRTHQPPLDVEWGQFRFAGLIELFRQRMHLLEVPATRIPQLVTELERDRQQVSLRSTKIISTTLQETTVADTASLKEKRARAILHLTIDQLNFDQLQMIQLPFGAFLNALGNTK